MEKILDIFAIGSIFFIFISLAYFWKQLPDQVPIHYNFAGTPDSWDGKNSLFILPVIAIFTFILFSVLRLFPHKWNYPFAITEQNAKQQYMIAISMVAWIKTLVIVGTAFLSRVMLQDALGRAVGIGFYTAPPFIFFSMISIGIYFTFSYKNR